ncbi:MAG: hypothetical protein JJ992_25955 [Planctomycetes bacterium]|nr:hypothetical protein [Planctomycetota bacterium]
MMQALTADMQGTMPDRARGAVWLKPENGFDDWTLWQDLDAADRELAALERELFSRVPPNSRVTLPEPGGDRSGSISPEADDGPALGLCTLRGLFFAGSLALLAGLGLLIASFFGERRGLWDWGLATIVMGQAALLLASLTPSRAGTIRFSRPAGSMMDERARPSA